MDKLKLDYKLDYLDDIMSKANYALMEGELNIDEWDYIIQIVIQIIKGKITKENKK